MAIYYNNQFRNYFLGSTGSLGAMYYGGVEVNPGQTTGGGGGGDDDATAYINAIISGGGTLSTPQQTAINTFFVDLKADGIYNKLYFMHPFLGGVANSNKKCQNGKMYFYGKP